MKILGLKLMSLFKRCKILRPKSFNTLLYSRHLEESSGRSGDIQNLVQNLIESRRSLHEARENLELQRAQIFRASGSIGLRLSGSGLAFGLFITRLLGLAYYIKKSLVQFRSVWPSRAREKIGPMANVVWTLARSCFRKTSC